MGKKERVDYLDIVKGIGVFLVVLGHMPSIIPEPVRMWIYSFHMPLFYFVSGYFARNYDDRKQVVKLLKKKAKKLILGGYLFFGLVFLLLDTIICKLSTSQVKQNVQGILLGTIDKVYWFFLSLFLVSALFLLVTLLIKSIEKQIIACFVIVLLGICCGTMDINYYRIGSSLYAYGFYYLAFLCRKYDIISKCILDFKYLLAAMSISIGGTVAVLSRSASVLDINYNYHHDILINYCIAISGIYVTFYVCWRLNRIGGLVPVKAIRNIGINSFFFFPILDYMPGMLRSILKSDGVIVKIMAYLIGSVIAYMVSWGVQTVKHIGEFVEK